MENWREADGSSIHGSNISPIRRPTGDFCTNQLTRLPVAAVIYEGAADTESNKVSTNSKNRSVYSKHLLLSGTRCLLSTFPCLFTPTTLLSVKWGQMRFRVQYIRPNFFDDGDIRKNLLSLLLLVYCSVEVILDISGWTSCILHAIVVQDTVYYCSRKIHCMKKLKKYFPPKYLMGNEVVFAFKKWWKHLLSFKICKIVHCTGSSLLWWYWCALQQRTECVSLCQGQDMTTIVQESAHFLASMC